MFTAALSSLILTASLSADALQSWGWRIPFLLALPLGMIGLYMRLKLGGVRGIRRDGRGWHAGAVPLLSALRENWRSILLVCGLVCAPTMCTYVLLVYGPTFFITELHIESSAARGPAWSPCSSWSSWSSPSHGCVIAWAAGLSCSGARPGWSSPPRSASC
ncbi:hypothetical protein P9209_14555 [Prescottella defluvii]|nr:hypothetical protein P9209_14555 [Prescottella defluvii]